MPGFDPQILKQGQQATAKALADRKALAESIAAQSAQIAAIQTQIARARQAGDKARLAQLQKQADKLQSARAAQQGKFAQIDGAWNAALGGFLALDPCDADPAFPLLLLPVRLETRYSGDKASLRIRILPDDIHIDQLDRGLTPDETAAGQSYWTSTWGKSADDPALDYAWRVLVQAAGSARAAWVALALTPSNLELPGASAPLFPNVTPPLKRAAIARLLPDRFVAVALQGADRSTATGSAITPELIVGLLSDDGSQKVTVNGVPVPPGAEWLVDYDKAVAAGMGINLKLKKPGAAVDRLFVFGVRSSLAPADAEKELGALLTAHRCARGIAFLPQGSPTNNTESDRSAWSHKPDPAPPPRSAPAPGSNAAVLAAALGIDPRTFAGLSGGDLAEQAAARAMETALWSPTWGSFLHAITRVNASGASLSDGNKEAARAFFRDNVRARGSLPSIRVGQQPYGVLPTSAVASRWKPVQGDTFEAGLLPLLRRMRQAWEAASAQVAHVGSGAPIDATLREVLGLNPISQGLRARPVLSAEGYAVAANIITGAPPAPGPMTSPDAMGALIEQMVYEDLNLLNFSHPFGSLGKARPLGLPLVDDTDPAVIDAILAGGSPKIASVLQALLALAWDQAQQAVKAAAPSGKLNGIRDLATAVPAATRAKVANVSGLGAAASSHTLNALANEVAAATGEAGFSRLEEHQPALSFQTSLADLALETPVAANRAALAGWALAAWARETAKQAEVREAMLLLKTLSTDARRILLCETLDLASHRLDAWLLGLVERRRATQRGSAANGISIGAYGWVENIAPGKGQRPDGGYIHAPSLDHAATAGILRSAYMTHNPDKGGTGAFAIDLSSARVRAAIDLMDGVRQGQPLGALLGYRIERGLHDARLDRFALTLRSLAPLVARRLTDRGEAAGTQAQAAVAANNVVDGLRLIELFNQSLAQNPNPIRAALDAVPKDNPYIKASDWPKVTDPEWTSFTRIMNDAAQAADAAADLLLAESVHQMAQGNTSGAAAALDAVGSGDAPPPEPDVVRTPSPGTPFVHRLILAAPADFASGAAGWNPARPRAQAEPRLEQWAQSRLGNASNIVVAAPPGAPLVTLDSAAVCALDLIYDSGDRAQLEQRLRAAIPSLPADQALSTTALPAWPAGSIGLGDAATYAASLRALLVSAQPSSASDFVRVNEDPARTFAPGDVSAAAARASAALGGLSTFRDHLDTAIATFDPANPATAVELRKQLEAVAAYGLVTPIVEGEHLLSVAQMASAEAARRIGEATAALAGPPDQGKINKASEAIFGAGFWILAPLTPPAAPDLLTGALGPAPYTGPPPRAEVRRWIRDAASVRNSAQRMSEALLLGDALGRPHTLRIAQLVEPGAPGGAAWIGGRLDPSQPTPRSTVTNLVMDAPAALDPAHPVIGLTVDSWTDVVPHRERRGENGAATIDERRVSGIAINAAASSARPPQAMLLAIAPDGQRWTTDAVIDTLSDTLSLAKIRAVTLETAPGYGRVLPAIYEASYSLQGERIFDLQAITAVNPNVGVLKYVKGGA